LFQTTFVVDEVSNIIKEVTFSVDVNIQFEAVERVYNKHPFSYIHRNFSCKLVNVTRSYI